ncbi:MAG: NAD(P)-dependent oxidoreductase [Myxococcota bacterium]
MKKIVLTGAAGRLGSKLRAPLSKMAESLVSSDISDIEALLPNETFVRADLEDKEAIVALLEGADVVVHFGAFVDEGPFEKLLGPNFVGAYHVWESAFQNGVRRVVYASSIHAVGMYPKNEAIDAHVPHRPDTFYGLAKCFAEDLGRMYFEKRGVEAVCLRILSCSPVSNARTLGSWLSDDDLVQLVQRAVDTPVTGFVIAYGVSNNDRCPVDNSAARFLGYRPKDNAEAHAEAILKAEGYLPHDDPNHMCHGGPFAGVELGKGAVADMTLD